MYEKGSNLPLIKQRNNILVKKMIYQHSPISRSEIAHVLNLTAPTITACVNPLITQGLIHEFTAPQLPEDDRPLGRRPTMLEFVRDAYYLCGVELGPYRTSMVLTDLSGHVIHSKQLGQLRDDYLSAVELLSQEIRQFLQDSNVASEKILGIGIALPGWINGTEGTIYGSFRKGWNSRDLAGDLRKKIGLPVVIENNVRARAICADLFDRAITADPAVYFYASFGLACPIIIDGKVVYGLSAGAGEIGHTTVTSSGPRCETCGRSGCLESVASEKAILRRCRTIMSTGVSTILIQLCPDPEALTIDHVLAAQECEDTIANMVVSDSIRHLGVTLASIINLISPETVLIDAHLMGLQRNQELMLATIQENIFDMSIKTSSVAFVPYDPMGGARGAAALTVKEFLLESTAEG